MKITNKDDIKPALMEITKKPSSIVISISKIVLAISILAGIIICIALAVTNIHYFGEGIIYMLSSFFTGLVLFSIIYGIGHILKNNEEMNEKMDK